MTRRADNDPEWLRRRYGMSGATAKEIAAETGYSVATIYRHAQPLNMNMRPAWPDRTEYDEAWLRRQYVDERRLVPDIAAEGGVAMDTVRKAHERFGLVGQGRGRGGHLLRGDAPSKVALITRSGDIWAPLYR